MTPAHRKPARRSRVLRDAVTSLSLANLCFIGSWNTLLDSSPRDAFNVYNYYSFVTIILNVLMLAAVFWTGVTLARRSESRFWLKIGNWLLPLALLIPLNGLLIICLPNSLFVWLNLGQFNATELLLIGLILVIPAALILVRRFKAAAAIVASAILLIFGRPEPIWFGLVLAILVFLLLARWRMRIVPALSSLLLVLAPFVLVTFFQAGAYARKFDDPPPAPRLVRATGPSPRVLWMVFDEMDQAMTFTRRHPTLTLPEIDRLSNQAIYASNAYPPSDSTLLSMPAMISGQLVSRAKTAGPADLMITYAGSTGPVKWSSQPSIFSKAREYGVNAAVIGWYHPYCRILGQNLSTCRYYGLGHTPFRESLTRQLKVLARTVPLADHYRVFREEDPQIERRQRLRETYLAMLAEAKKAVVDPDLGLTLLHWPIPHPPAIFNHFTSQFDFTEQSGYVGNLSLVDRTIGELRRDMEDAGLWDDTTVLITADHWFRSEIHFRSNEDEESLAGKIDHRVPFILKLEGQTERVEYHREFNNVLVHDLLVALLSGELKGVDSVVRWLDSSRSIAESPYRYKRES